MTGRQGRSRRRQDLLVLGYGRRSGVLLVEFLVVPLVTQLPLLFSCLIKVNVESLRNPSSK